MNPLFIYTIDVNDTIIQVNENWLQFALDNNSSYLNEETILGKNLWNFISGDEVIEIYQIILRQVRKFQKEICFNYRCDSPNRTRLLAMRILPSADNSIIFENQILQEKSRQYIKLVDPLASRSPAFIQQCSWCKRLKTAQGWQEVEDAIQTLRLFETTEFPMIAHGVCQTCKTSLQRQAQQSLRNNKPVEIFN